MARLVSLEPEEPTVTTELTHCAHKACKCRVEAADAVRQNGAVFCSQRCADDRGCDHEGCNCGDFPAPEPQV
jgi:hypothetical protein